jgi:hypothetical protein
MEVEGFSDVGRGEKSGFKKDNKFLHKKLRHEGEWNRKQDTSKGEKPKQFQSSGFKPKGNFVKKGVPFKASQPKEDVGGKPKGACFNCNEVGHYSKDCPKAKIHIHIFESARECEGMSPHTPEWTPILGIGIPMKSQIFKK